MTTALDQIQWTRITATGDDAAPYLQGQLTQDLTNLGATGRWSLLLAPDSVVLASCFVTSIGGDVSLVVERDAADIVLTRLRRFVLRSRVTFDVRDEVDGPFRTVEERVVAGWPGAPEFATGLTPHAFGSSLVRETVSFTKGCYTGQELVGRLDARGANVPWRLVRLWALANDWSVEPLLAYGPTGPQALTTIVRRDDQIQGLAVVHRSLLNDLDRIASNGLRVAVID